MSKPCSAPDKQESTTTYVVYVELLEEGTLVWRPITAYATGDGNFVLSGVQPSFELWQFPVGSIVRCVERQLSDGLALVAVELAGGA